MPTANFVRKSVTVPFLPGEHSSGGTSAVGCKMFDHQWGANRYPSERPMTSITYTRRTALLSGSRLARPQWTYAPTPTDGSVPYWPESLGTRQLLTPETRVANNSAYENFLEEFQGETSSLGVAAAEGRETFSMVANRVGGLYRSYRKLRKGDFRGFLKELSVKPKGKHRNKIRASATESSALWLEYWFGWAPTVADLYDTAAVLSSAHRYPSDRFHGSSGCMLGPKAVQIGSSGDTYVRRMTSKGKYIVKTGATVKLVNPDTFLMNRLGLINPATVAWELVPFSFVVDWFTSFGSVISAFTDLAGVEISDAYWVWHYKGTVNGVYGRTSATEAPSIYDWNVSRTERFATLLRPVTTRPRWLNLAQSQTRAATAVSLLTQLFLSK